MRFTLIMALIIFTSGMAQAQTQTGAEILEQIDKVLAPEKVTMKMRMETHRSNGSTKTYEMTLYKLKTDLSRVEFTYPAVEKGRTLLRRGDNSWMHLKNLKRPIRIAFRDNFMGGDFNNSDVLRLNLRRDYTAVIKSQTATEWVLSLKAKNQSVAYATATMWVKKSGYILYKAHYFTVSGKLLREMLLSEIKDFHGHKRPAKILMRNMLSKKSYSVMVIKDFRAGKTLRASMFRPDSLSR